MIRDNFAAFILSHKRPGMVTTYRRIREHGYTGKIFIVVDDKDPSLEDYKLNYGEEVLVFSKDDIGERIDIGDNLSQQTSDVWARNAIWELARKVGVQYLVQLDDDYNFFGTRGKTEIKIKDLDSIFEAFVEFLSIKGVSTIAFSQGGDHIGGFDGRIRLKRKAMNSFFCDTSKPFPFLGRLNDDVNTYVTLGWQGMLFFTMSNVDLHQDPTQTNPGGMTEAYKDNGTYAKSFYSVMYAPSCVSIGRLKDKHERIHHKVNWDATAPCILHERHKKPNLALG